MTVHKPFQKALIRHAISAADAKIVYEQDFEGEKKLAASKVVALPDIVSTQSSVHNIRSETGEKPAEDEVDMGAGIRSDFVS